MQNYNYEFTKLKIGKNKVSTKYQNPKIPNACVNCGIPLSGFNNSTDEEINNIPGISSPTHDKPIFTGVFINNKRAGYSVTKFEFYSDYIFKKAYTSGYMFEKSKVSFQLPFCNKCARLESERRQFQDKAQDASDYSSNISCAVTLTIAIGILYYLIKFWFPQNSLPLKAYCLIPFPGLLIFFLIFFGLYKIFGYLIKDFIAPTKYTPEPVLLKFNSIELDPPPDLLEWNQNKIDYFFNNPQYAKLFEEINQEIIIDNSD